MHFFRRERKYFLNTYNRIPLEISHGIGSYLYTVDGEKYLDFFSGLAVNALGYSHPKIVKAILDQTNKFTHISNYFTSNVQIEVAELLVKHSGLDRVFFTNSGTEAIEASLKIIRKKYGPNKKIFSLTSSFHGRTYGSLGLTSNINYKNSFKPMLPGFSKLKFNNVTDLRSKIDNNTAAIYLEIIQGEGGVNLVSEEYIKILIDLRKKFNFAIVADEIQTGVGRTGKKFAFEHFKFSPDILVLAKAIGGGLPLGAVLTSGDFNEVLIPGDHGTTFGGNPVACAAGKIVIKEVFENELYKMVDELGSYLIDQLKKLQSIYPNKIKEVRGRGFMIGIAVASGHARKIVDNMLQQKIIINLVNDKTLRLLPPLNIKRYHIKSFLEIFKKVVNSISI